MTEAEDMFLKANEIRAWADDLRSKGNKDLAAQFDAAAEQFDQWGREAQREPAK